MSLFTAKETRHEPTRAREVYDVSGAGDTVIAVLALMVAAGADLHAAMRVANHAAGIVVAKLGTAVARREELEASLAANP
jgi:bifunctional ADP-heptose synthase (sugar kinase/adenylyltransferase)